MDPLLQQMSIAGRRSDTIEVILRLASGSVSAPERVRAVTRFGDIVTGRIRRGDIHRVWADPRVASLKAPRLLEFERPLALPSVERAEPRRPPNLPGSGRGVVVGVIDYGFDVFAAPMIDRAGSRVLALWDQRTPQRRRNAPPPVPFGYGRVFYGRDIDGARRTARPYRTLDYHPADSDRGGGAHGTHVTSIAAGSASAGPNAGMAPEAKLVLVHLASGPLSGLATLGDGLRILEAVSFILRVAGRAPAAINLSVGRHSGFHTGLSLVEQGLDRAVELRPGTAIAQSAGNYRSSATHTEGRLTPGERREIGWIVGPEGVTGDELEIFYSNRDELGFALHPPGAPEPIRAALGESRVLYDGAMNEIGRIYHRAFDPNSPDHHIAIYLAPRAPAGRWTVALTGRRISDGRYHGWIERDPGGRRDQTRFAPEDVHETSTVGSIANGFLTIAVGAADDRGPFALPAKFGSLGPTRDGRVKPDVLAPGVGIVGARSTPASADVPLNLSATMSGASQASPYVCGLAALCLEAGGHLTAHELRRAIVGTARDVQRPAADDANLPGIVDAEAAVAMARLIRTRSAEPNEEIHA